MTLENVMDILDGEKQKRIIAEIEQFLEQKRAEWGRTQAEMEAAVGLVLLSGEPVVFTERPRTPSPPMRLQRLCSRNQPKKTSTLLANCRNIVKEILGKNGYADYPSTSKTPKPHKK